MSGPAGFASELHNRARGAAAEEAGATWLARSGYQIVGRNLATEAGEIDVVARDGEVLCFVEIKARASARYGPAIAAVDRRKQRRLARAAALYLAAHPWDGACRFDVLGMDPAAEGWAFTLIKNAFDAAR